MGFASSAVRFNGAHVGLSGLTDPGERSANKSCVSPGRRPRGSASAPLHHRANSAQMLRVGGSGRPRSP
jgi:hypothetical protein